MASKTKKTINLAIPLIVLVVIFLVVVKFTLMPHTQGFVHKDIGKRLWDYQCVDTMKTSRDKARAWKDWKGHADHVKKETALIRTLGANCIAISTPYDKEFLPILKMWVNEARKNNMHVWFRGNFSSWEGWFEYPKGMSIDKLFESADSFIVENPSLFRDGDIFTIAPEGENGGPFEQVEVYEHEAFREFLIEEEQVAKSAFKKINKKVITNWYSMNGGLAQRMLDQATVDGIGGVVTIDHYIKTSPEMGEFIRYFKDKFGAQVVLGEFGAPIPEINGPMNEKEQAEFIDKLFEELYVHRDTVLGVNYWTAYDGSTALFNENLSLRPAADVVQKYFTPVILAGRITDTIGDPIEGALVSIDNNTTAPTDKNGNYRFIFPKKNVTVSVTSPGHTKQQSPITYSTNGESKTQNFSLEPTNPSFIYYIKKIIRGKF